MTRRSAAAVRYDVAAVTAHGEARAKLLLINEAPGPCETITRVPCSGAQGGTIYRFLRKAEVPWASSGPDFSWPNNPDDRYPNQGDRLEARRQFLALRARYMVVTNAYDKKPSRDDGKGKFCAPLDRDVLGDPNIHRLRAELQGCPGLKVILIGGRSAYLACTGVKLDRPAEREGSALRDDELAGIAKRLGARFDLGWYAGHTRRWSTNTKRTLEMLNQAAERADWKSR